MPIPSRVDAVLSPSPARHRSAGSGNLTSPTSTGAMSTISGAPVSPLLVEGASTPDYRVAAGAAAVCPAPTSPGAAARSVLPRSSSSPPIKYAPMFSDDAVSTTTRPAKPVPMATDKSPSSTPGAPRRGFLGVNVTLASIQSATSFTGSAMTSSLGLTPKDMGAAMALSASQLLAGKGEIPAIQLAASPAGRMMLSPNDDTAGVGMAQRNALSGSQINLKGAAAAPGTTVQGLTPNLSGGSLARSPSGQTGPSASNLPVPMKADELVAHLSGHFLHTIMLDVQSSDTSSGGVQKRIIGATLKRDFFKHRAFRWYSTSSAATKSGTGTNNAKVVYDVVFKTSGVMERVGQTEFDPTFVIYDENGDRDETAYKVGKLLKQHRKELHVYYLVGGIERFARTYPWFVDPRPAVVGKDGDNSAAATIQELRSRQAAILGGRLLTPSLILHRDGREVLMSKRWLADADPNPSSPSLDAVSTVTSPKDSIAADEVAPLSPSSPEPPPGLTDASNAGDQSGDNGPGVGLSLAEEKQLLDNETAGNNDDTEQGTESAEDVSTLPEDQPFLYLSGIRGATEPHLKHLKITHVLNITQHPHPSNMPGVDYLKIALDDVPSARIDLHFQQALDFINSARAMPNGRCLVHCFAGVSRSTSLVLAYLMSAQGCTLAQAYHTTFRSRPVIQPNEGFSKKLQKLEKELRGSRYPSLVYGWMSPNNTNFRDFIEFTMLHDDLQSKLNKRAASSAGMMRSESHKSSADTTAPTPPIKGATDGSSPSMVSSSSHKSISPGVSPIGSMLIPSASFVSGTTTGNALLVDVPSPATSRHSSLSRNRSGSVGHAEAAMPGPPPGLPTFPATSSKEGAAAAAMVGSMPRRRTSSPSPVVDLPLSAYFPSLGFK
ncbi:hypothetical protein AMAG_00614 [Allomyces macrogynus ATCC 38327]|uniref:protein-tyrosine-phosphatase n=1 Tax=Allomyces macrogynus (strain ATCC 38327) TaxID=578462 RepID=A0A0L0RX11_ALLM3|nr:hypothetical protein AMAG_00614 [Allomyces macrogynus ATCC 38327]|eukprot:KNE54654.1 hypothetical protein AMAG_00614 [Allomyces macrogynus ATCC 38327]